MWIEQIAAAQRRPRLDLGAAGAGCAVRAVVECAAVRERQFDLIGDHRQMAVEQRKRMRIEIGDAEAADASFALLVTHPVRDGRRLH